MLKLYSLKKKLNHFQKALHLDTGLLQNISKVLNHDFFSYYTNALPIIKDENGAYSKKLDIIAGINEELKVCKKQLAELQKKYDLLEEAHLLTKEKLAHLIKHKPKKK